MVCQFDRNDECFEDCPQCSRYKAHYCDSCGGEFDRDDLVDGLCPECHEEYFYCDECGGQIFEDVYYDVYYFLIALNDIQNVFLCF